MLITDKSRFNAVAGNHIVDVRADALLALLKTLFVKVYLDLHTCDLGFVAILHIVFYPLQLSDLYLVLLFELIFGLDVGVCLPLHRLDLTASLFEFSHGHLCLCSRGSKKFDDAIGWHYN